MVVSAVANAGQRWNVAERGADPLAVADRAGHPLGSGCRLTVDQLEHGTVITGAFQVGDERASGQVSDVLVGELQWVGGRVAFRSSRSADCTRGHFLSIFLGALRSTRTRGNQRSVEQGSRRKVLYFTHKGNAMRLLPPIALRALCQQSAGVQHFCARSKQAVSISRRTQTYRIVLGNVR